MQEDTLSKKSSSPSVFGSFWAMQKEQEVLLTPLFVILPLKWGLD
ncbi:hypothetical protein AsAng_0020180 [Aureispira anguillae]|uniref:Uncharacterized protein n=1 Tax=Aureispira anguillae TaxID=2864201 RepID=A0A916DT95_9BACT|nr:hypothetical protein AsAng_0020180 [Aureispira anguillae]